MTGKDKRGMHILARMNRPPAEGNFCDYHGKAQKPVTVEDYKGYIDKWDRTANSYLVCWRT